MFRLHFVTCVLHFLSVVKQARGRSGACFTSYLFTSYMAVCVRMKGGLGVGAEKEEWGKGGGRGKGRGYSEGFGKTYEMILDLTVNV